MKQDMKRCPRCKRLVNAARANGIHTCSPEPEISAVVADPVSGELDQSVASSTDTDSINDSGGSIE